ncbi:MAG: AAA family ATPase [Chloroflexi bacterium]|nr:AAA family ATPase [Chloroflexota bacterium]
MDIITRIEIKHFRSIDQVVIDELSDINVFSGLNDVGKSNVIKALNLFFNFQVDWQNDLDFDRDLNRWHLHQARHAHDKRDISVKLEFERPTDKYSSLPNRFWIKREWDRGNQRQPLRTTWGKEWSAKPERTWKPGLTWFLKFTEFVYVPAIRDRLYLRHLLGVFSKTITDMPDKHLEAASENLSNLMESRSSDLRQKLKRATGIDVTLQLPQTMLSLLEASGLLTEEGIPLELHGDGIQSLAVSGILADLNARQSSYRYIWGFEEPENSLEYIKAAELADEILESYSKDAQVFITTHSPAFISMKTNRTSIYHIKSDNKQCEHQDHEEKYESTTSTVTQVFGNLLFDEVSELSEELGFLDVMRSIDKDFRDFDSMRKEFEKLKQKLDENERPLLIVEGPNDCKTLCEVWRNLYENDMPFDVLPAGGTDKMTSLLGNSRTSNRRILALYDHDEGGAKEIKNLCKYGFVLAHGYSHIEYRFQQLMVAQTLPAPPGRECNAQNYNLPLEFYFSDEVLLDIHHQSGETLFSRNNFVQDRQTYHVPQDHLEREIAENRLSMCHRKLQKPKGNQKTGKALLVEKLGTFQESDFENFDALFGVILGHLEPEFPVKRRAANLT